MVERVYPRRVVVRLRHVNASRPILGLLLDVDGPIASPITRTINIPSIAEDLVALANAGVPIAFNTGRSDAFLREVVVPPLLAAGLAADVRLYGICEKGAVWFGFSAAGVDELSLDEDVAMPDGYGRTIEALVNERYADTVFFDYTKRAMVSVEQHVEVPAADYAVVRRHFDTDARAELARRGFGVEHAPDRFPDDAGLVQYRIDPTIISTDIESVRLGKDLGAERALELLEADGGALPIAWRTVGDSRSDYAMADWLFEHGYEVEHVDVRPADGVPEKPYPVLTHSTLIHDEAGAAYLARWVEMVRGEAIDDADVG
ncbi:Hydroxymethylpyrimidine pyrophosphatase [Plantibacter sp. RU18]